MESIIGDYGLNTHPDIGKIQGKNLANWIIANWLEKPYKLIDFKFFRLTDCKQINTLSANVKCLALCR